MARHTYVTKGYSNNGEREGGYGYEPEQNVKWYMVETTTVGRARVPATSYTKFGGARLLRQGIKEHMPKYAPKDHHEGYELHNGSSYENSRHHEVENIMANFLNKIQIDAASRPTNEYRTRSPNRYQPSSTDKYRHMSPGRYRHTSPDKYRPTSPSRYRPTSPHMYRPISSKNYRHTSPDKYQCTSPNKYRPRSPNKYRYTSPDKFRHPSPDKYRHPSPDRYRHPSSDKYWHPSPDKYRRTSPDKYRHPSPNKYRHTSPRRNYPSKENHISLPQTLSCPDEAQHTRPGNFLGPNNRWHSEGLPTSRHPRMILTNDINEALRFLEDSVDYSTWSDPKKAGANNWSHGAHTIEHERQYTSYAYMSATTQPYLRRLKP